VPEETNQKEETTQEAPAVEQKLATTEVDVPPTESKTAEPDEEDIKLADEEGNEAAVSPIREEDLKFTEDIENEDQADLEGDNEIED